MVSKTSGASTLHRGKVSGKVQDATCHAVVMVSATVQDATCHAVVMVSATVQDATCHAVVMVSATVQDATCHGDCLRLLLAHHQGLCIE